MKYNQLDTAAKEQARNAWRETVAEDSWYDSVYTDVVTTGALMGIEITNRCVKTVGGKEYASPDISFTGPQGDGVSFGGYLDTTKFKDATVQLSTHIGELSEAHPVHIIGRQAERLYEMIAVHQTYNRLSGEAEDDQDCPECTIGLRVNVNDKNGWQTSHVDASDIPENIEVAMNEFVRDFANYIHLQIEAEYGYLTSDESVIAAIEANEPDFDEDGNFK